MSIKASKHSLAQLLADTGDDDLIAHKKATTLTSVTAKETPALIEKSPETAANVNTLPQPDIAIHSAPKPIPGVPIMSHTTGTPTPPTIMPSFSGTSTGTEKLYRSQGMTIYESDDDLVDGFVDFLRKKKLRIGRKKGFSLFARAGLRALEEVRQRNPVQFEELLMRALLEQK